jgi:hypothetical protein
LSFYSLLRASRSMMMAMPLLSAIRRGLMPTVKPMPRRTQRLRWWNAGATRRIDCVGFALVLIGMLAVCVSCSLHSANRAAVQPSVTDAASIVTSLREAGMPIGEQQSSDASKQASGSPLDPPVRYVSRTFFRDTRLHATKPTIDPVDGGQILVYANADDAQEMLRWLAMVSEGAVFGSHDYAHGAVVLRLTDDLTDAQAEAYDQALQRVLSDVATPSGD